MHFTKPFDQALDADCDKEEYEIRSIGEGELNRWVEEKDYILSPKSKEISHTLGFSSRQYFSTVFKRVTGVSLDEFILFGKRANKRKNLFFRLIQIIVVESPELGVPGNHR